MHRLRHENLWSLDLGIRTPLPELTSQERTIVDFRHEHFNPLDPSYIGIQKGLPGIQPDMAFSPHGEAIAKIKDAERIEAVMLELKRMIRI